VRYHGTVGLVLIVLLLFGSPLLTALGRKLGAAWRGRK
jgi:hypothetical protein